MVEKLDPDFIDPVEGPRLVDTVEQKRTRSTHHAPEREEDRAARTDPLTSSMEQNLLGHAGVDDRGVEDRGR
jgi:hypothetical protein